jgi:hypothetical protein
LHKFGVALKKHITDKLSNLFSQIFNDKEVKIPVGSFWLQLGLIAIDFWVGSGILIIWDSLKKYAVQNRCSLFSQISNDKEVKIPVDFFRLLLGLIAIGSGISIIWDRLKKYAIKNICSLFSQIINDK